MPALAATATRLDQSYEDQTSDPFMSTDELVSKGHFGTLPFETRRSLLTHARGLGIDDLFARTELLLSRSTAGVPA